MNEAEDRFTGRKESGSCGEDATPVSTSLNGLTKKRSIVDNLKATLGAEVHSDSNESGEIKSDSAPLESLSEHDDRTSSKDDIFPGI